MGSAVCISNNYSDKCVVSRFFAPEVFYEEERKLLSKIEGDVGICFSGGSTRSSCLTFGYLRALTYLGVLKKVKYISCLNGSSFTVLPYIYKQNMKDDKFFGKIIHPSKLSWDSLTSNGIFTYFLSKLSCDMINDLKNYYAPSFNESDDTNSKNDQKDSKSWSELLKEIFLDPYGCGNSKKFFSYNLRTSRSICDQNIDILMKDFIVPKEKKPYWICGGAIIHPVSLLNTIRIPFEFTPLGCGSPLYEPIVKDCIFGYVESFAFGGKKRRRVNNKICEVNRVYAQKKQTRFSLMDVLGAAHLCLEGNYSQFRPVDVLIREKKFPKINVFSPISRSSGKKVSCIDYAWIDKLGIFPLLRRKVKSIMLFYNTYIPLNSKRLPKDLECLFQGNTKSRVFENPSTFKNLMMELMMKKKEGSGSVASITCKVKTNKYHKIKGGWNVELLVVYNAYVPKFFNLIKDKKLRDKLNSDEYVRFPFLKDTFENDPYVFMLDEHQGNLLSQLASYVVLENSQLFERAIRKQKQKTKNKKSKK